MQMQCIDEVTQALGIEESLDREWDSRLGPVLDEAIEAVEYAWAGLAMELQRIGYPAEKPVPENATRYSYFNAIKWDALEMSDSIYWSLSNDEREKDDRDLEEFEATFSLKAEYSTRIKALAFLTAGKILVGDD